VAHVSRVGVSLLHHAGLAEFVAQTDEQFVAVAARLARDTARLRELRGTLRSRLATSQLMNGADFARRFAQACELMLRDAT
jgi:protein O-GlcNAc transferase